MKLSTQFRIEAAHHYPKDQSEIYGACTRVHGHSYKIRLTIQGVLNDQGWIMDLGKLQEIVKNTIIDKCDHRLLNEVYPDEITTSENLGLIWSRAINAILTNSHPGVFFHSLEVWEMENTCATIEKEDLN
jgi:6-pyruvoyltetrahydropterin/6-carboxytetrahydropterin synthase